MLLDMSDESVLDRKETPIHVCSITSNKIRNLSYILYTENLPNQ